MKYLLKLANIALLVLCLSSTLSGQVTRQDSVWNPLKYFIGTWSGTGMAGGDQGNYERSYRFIFNNRFIEVRNKSTYPPSEGKPNGEVHEDLGYISYDKGRKVFVLRQFHIEGFVNQYKLDTLSADRKTMVFTSEAIENIAAGWAAKERYQILNNNEFIETFELAEPGKAFEPYSKVKLKRQ